MAVSGSLKGKESWEPGGGGAVKEPSLQRKLKIARRDDVIRFPQLSNPLSLTHTHTHTHTHAHAHTHIHTQSHSLRYTETQGWACTHTPTTHTLSHIGEGRLLGPKATGAGKSGKCVCICVCLCWHEQDCICQSICLCALTRCMHVCVCVLICRHVCVLLPVSGGKVYMYLCQCIYVYKGVLGMYLHAGVNLLHCLAVFICLHDFLDCITCLYRCGHPCGLWALASQPPALTGGSAPSPKPQEASSSTSIVWALACQ